VIAGQGKLKVFIIFGTRPEAIKMAPVIKELEKHNDKFVVRVCVTAQHREMLDQVLRIFELQPDYDLNLMKPGQDLFDVTVCVLQGLKEVLRVERPDLVLVQGDTTTTMAGSLAAFYHQIPVGHVEAGLRTHNKFAPFPEEINRQITTVIADLHFAPTKSASDSLLREGVKPEAIYVTGNTVIDALFLALESIRKKSLAKRITMEMTSRFPSLERLFVSGRRTSTERRLILVTGHRRENFGRGFENICLALKAIANSHSDVDIVYPVHLNPNVQEPVRRILNGSPNIHLIDPLEYLPFVYLMDQCYMIITDSGGIQEEAPSLRKPVLVMRDTTERPEAVNAGAAQLVGTETARIVAETNRLLEDLHLYEKMSKAENPYGDGKASSRILEKLLELQHKNG
jgi:UDP-N-acetylglucosamine 2-epimerase (non-hydrolysing)